MNKKPFLILLTFLITVLLLQGCTETPICGDNICQTEEKTKNSTYYCLEDCGTEQTPVSLQTCQEFGGIVCRENEECDGSWVDASDTNYCCKGICYSTGPRGQLTVKTKKESYFIGETVALTDPPKVQDWIQPQKEEKTGETVSEAEEREKGIVKPVKKAESEGYIVEIDFKPIIEYLNQLNKKAGGKITESQKNSLVQAHRENIIRILNLAEQKIKEALPETKIVKVYKEVFSGFSVRIESGNIPALEELGVVKKVHPNYEVKAVLMDSIPLIKANQAWELKDGKGNKIRGKGTTIAIIDTGIDYTHPDLGGCFGEGCKVVGGYDFVNGDSDPIDDHLHGTHCAGIAAGNGALKGVAPEAKLYAYKVLNSMGSGYADDIIAAIERSVDPNQDGNYSDKIDVISLSLGGYGNPDDPMSTAIDNAVKNGVVAAVAAGNSGPYSNTIRSPGTARKAITVGATYKKDYNGAYWGDQNPKTDQITSFSSRGPVKWGEEEITKPDVVAPGALICATRYDEVFPEGQHSYYKPCLDKEHLQLAGTSMATPHVAGLAALIKQKHPDWSAADIKKAVKATAIDLGYEPNTQGSGRADALAAVSLKSKPPTAKIQTRGRVSGKIDINGSAYGENFSKYVLELGYDQNNKTTWQTLSESNSQVKEGVLYRGLNTLDYKDGGHKLKLTVQNKSGLSIEDYAKIEIENISIKAKSLCELDSAYKVKVGETYFPGKKEIEVMGSVLHNSFDHYKIEWGKGKNPNQWSESGITLTDNGKKEVKEGLLGIFDTDSIEENDIYTLKLTVWSKEKEVLGEELWNMLVDPNIHSGWPKNIMENCSQKECYAIDQPTAADLDMDGKDELVFALGQKILVYNGRGEFLRGWPAEINTKDQGEYADLGYSPAVADIDNDNKNELIIGDSIGYLHVFNELGEYEAGWPKRILEQGLTSPVIEDLENDRKKEILFTDNSSQVFAVDSEGNIKDGWPQETDSYGNLSVGDIDGDKFSEVIVSNGEMLEAYNYKGKSLKGWPRKILEKYGWGQKPVLADLDEDNDFEVIINSGEGYLHVLKGDGNNLPGWPKEFDTQEISQIHRPSVGDIDFDGKAEIVFLTREKYSNQYYINAYKANGKPVDGFPSPTLALSSNYTLLLADIHSTYGLEIIPYSLTYHRERSCNIGSSYAYSAQGRVVKGFPIKIISGPTRMHAIGDFDGDEKNEYALLNWIGWIMVWDMPQGKRADWPMPLQNPQHTSRLEISGIPKPKSQLVNTGNIEIEGVLLMKVQFFENQEWIDNKTVVKEKITLYPDETIALDKKWANQGAFQPEKSGEYRVYAVLLDTNGEVIIAGNKLEDTSEFTVTGTNTCQDGTPFGQCSEQKPKYCEQGELTDKCTECSCPKGKECVENTEKCREPIEPMPDLVIESISVNADTDTISAIIKNTGTKKAESFTTEITLKDKHPDGGQWMEPLKPGETETRTRTPYLIITAGKHKITVEADPDNRIKESNENNNTKEITGNFGPQPTECGDGKCMADSTNQTQLIHLPLNKTKTFKYKNNQHKIKLTSILDSGEAILEVDGIQQKAKNYHDYTINNIPIKMMGTTKNWPEKNYTWGRAMVGEENFTNCYQDCMKKCFDSDNGINTHERGSLVIRPFGWIDVCAKEPIAGSPGLPKGPYLSDKICKNNQADREFIKCQCKNGVCIE